MFKTIEIFEIFGTVDIVEITICILGCQDILFLFDFFLFQFFTVTFFLKSN